MFDPAKPDMILQWVPADLATELPTAEDDGHEYKSSATKDNDLAEKIGKAASGFWNSGGGLFVAGVTGGGQPDGGIDVTVGRQSRRDWIDQAVARVEPRGPYVVQGVDRVPAAGNIGAGKAVYLVGFGESESGPHMAPDHRYYVRAGAHTSPAKHFIVDAIYARRGLKTPLLRHVLRRKPGDAGVFQVGIVNLSPTAALSVTVMLHQLGPGKGLSAGNQVFEIPVISDQFPLFFDVYEVVVEEKFLPSFQVTLRYRDLAGRSYPDQILEVNLHQQVGPELSALGGQLREQRLESAVERVAEAIRNKR